MVALNIKPNRNESPSHQLFIEALTSSNAGTKQIRIITIGPPTDEQPVFLFDLASDEGERTRQNHEHLFPS